MCGSLAYITRLETSPGQKTIKTLSSINRQPSCPVKSPLHSVARFLFTHLLSKMSFSKSAKNTRLDNSILSAKLQRRDGSWAWSSIDLNNHLSISGGVIQLGAGNRNFTQSCVGRPVLVSNCMRVQVRAGNGTIRAVDF